MVAEWVGLRGRNLVHAGIFKLHLLIDPDFYSRALGKRPALQYHYAFTHNPIHFPADG
jgi:hypothetical protein